MTNCEISQSSPPLAFERRYSHYQAGNRLRPIRTRIPASLIYRQPCLGQTDDVAYKLDFEHPIEETNRGDGLAVNRITANKPTFPGRQRDRIGELPKHGCYHFGIDWVEEVHQVSR